MNTLKFGNGEWYGKEGTILAYNDENNNYKPLPFTFDRDSVATRVNKQGLIETVGADQPRIDYLNDSNGALLLEPSRTNLITYSEDFSQSVWQKNSVGSASAPIIASNFAVSPDGTQNATRVQFNISGSTSSDRSSLESVFALDGSSSYTLSFYIKSNTGVNQNLSVWLNSVYGNNITVTNEWVRVEQTFSSNSTFNRGFGLAASGDIQQSVDVLIFGFQLEQGSYATSIINTKGSAVTRLADNTKIVNSPILQATNQFTLFFDAKDFINYGTTFANIMFTLGAGESAYDVGTGIHIYNKIWYYFNGSSALTLGDCYNATTDSKFAISYDGTKFTRYANGVKLGTNTVSASMSNWDTLTNGNLSYSGVDRVFDLADLKLYDTALTDQEAIALTQV